MTLEINMTFTQNLSISLSLSVFLSFPLSLSLSRSLFFSFSLSLFLTHALSFSLAHSLTRTLSLTFSLAPSLSPHPPGSRAGAPKCRSDATHKDSRTQCISKCHELRASTRLDAVVTPHTMSHQLMYT